jgi:hypothetical protein
MSAKEELIAAQRRWAESLGLRPDPRGYLDAVALNLRAPLSRQAEASLRRGSGGELKDRPARNGRPARAAKMKAVHSSAVLAVNVFDYWSERDPTPLGAALDVRELKSIEFEAQHGTGLDGTPPNLDIELRLGDGSLMAIESKFTEWLSPRSRRVDPFKAKYFPAEAKLWQDRKLSNCQELAEALQRRAHAYRYLNAPQLLKHALGLGTTTAGRFSLLYLYYEGTGDAASTHRQEIADFSQRLATEMSFMVLTYQELFSRLRLSAAEHEEYLTYLERRYFAKAAA